MLVLRDVLAFPAAEVAAMLGTATASVKSALQRGRARLAELTVDEACISEPTERRGRELLDQYMAAFENADVAALEKLRLDDVVLEATPLSGWYSGLQTCLPFLRDNLLGSPGDWRMVATSANGQPAAAVWCRDDTGSYRPYGICVLTVTELGISRITSFGDPRLLPPFGYPST